MQISRRALLLGSVCPILAQEPRFSAGVDVVTLFATVRELFESAVLLAREALRALGVDEREAERIEAEYRRRDARRLELQSRSGDIRVARELMCDKDLLVRRYGLADGGAVLVRPDGHIAWTCTRAVEPITQLLTALELTLGRVGDPTLAVSA